MHVLRIFLNYDIQENYITFNIHPENLHMLQQFFQRLEIMYTCSDMSGHFRAAVSQQRFPLTMSSNYPDLQERILRALFENVQNLSRINLQKHHKSGFTRLFVVIYQEIENKKKCYIVSKRKKNNFWNLTIVILEPAITIYFAFFSICRENFTHYYQFSCRLNLR